MMAQATIHLFDGQTYVPDLDEARLKTNLHRVLALLLDGEPHTLDELRRVGGAAGDARARDLRKPRWGGFDVSCTRDEDDTGVWWYQLHPPVTEAMVDTALGVAP